MQFELLQELAKVLGDASDADIPYDTIRRTVAEAIAFLAVREARIFRDWQDAVGEWMLIESTTGTRRFDVSGYRAFISTPADASDGQGQWRLYLAELTVELDVDGNSQRVARIAQLGGVYVAVAKLLVEFHEAERSRSAIGALTLSTAKRTIREREPDTPPTRCWSRLPGRNGAA